MQQKKVQSMKASQFYQLCDMIDSLDKEITNMYFPTVNELKNHHVEKDIRKFLPILLFFSNNPFKNSDFIGDEDRESYEEMVKYVNELISEIKLT